MLLIAISLAATRKVCWPLHVSNAGYWTNSEGCIVLMLDKLSWCNGIKLNANRCEAALTLNHYVRTDQQVHAESWWAVNPHFFRLVKSDKWIFMSNGLSNHKNYVFIEVGRWRLKIYWLWYWKKQLPAKSASWSSDLRGGALASRQMVTQGLGRLFL